MVWMAYPIEEQIRITDIYTFFEVHHDEGYDFPGEAHNFWECFYVENGEVCVSGDERVYNLHSGDIIFHKPLEFHKFTVQGDRGADLLIFSFAAGGCLTSYLRDKVFQLSDSQKKILAGMLAYIHTTIKELGVAEEFDWYLKPVQILPTYSQMLCTYLQQLMLSLAEKGDVSGVSQAPDAICFSRAINYLNSNVHRQPTVAEIARFCSISEAGIKRLFDKYAGIGVHKYFLKLKIKAATELLMDGESVSNVALRLGFNSQSYFSRAFKRETGKMPSQVRGR